jgi:aspartate racemase
MKKIGIIGGIGWPSTIEYYRHICELSLAYHANLAITGPAPMPEILIESLNLNFAATNRGTSEPGSWDVWDTYFNNALGRLSKGGAELILIAAVTPHARLKEISKGINVPILSVYEAVGSQCKKQNIEKLLVLGTGPTMSSSAFKDGMHKYGVRAFYPQTEELKTKVLGVIERLYQNKTEGTSEEIAKLVYSCVSEEELNKTAVCLGCTELSLAFHDFKDESGFVLDGISYLNSSVAHTKIAFEACVIQ